MDKEATIGAKTSKKFWYAFKEHVAVDMQNGMINRVAVTTATVPDSVGSKHVMPRSGAVCADKGYVSAIPETLCRGVHLMVILKNNMKEKTRFRPMAIGTSCPL
jgi:hypothetical protein